MNPDPRKPRAPQVFDADDPSVQETPEPTSTDQPTDRATTAPPPDDTESRVGETVSRFDAGIRWGALLFSAAVGLATLAAGLWFSRFVSVAVTRADWLGWIAKGLAVIIAAALVVLLAREVFGFLRLARLGRIRRLAEQAIATRDAALEKRAAQALKRLAAGRPEASWALSRFREKERHQTKPGELIGLADSVLLASTDQAARRIIYESARRVSVVSAVVPITLITVLFVLFENIRMVRRLAAAYGGRPGFFGGVRLLWRVITYVAASGAVALTDDLFGQFLSQDIVHRLSRRLGEGVFNGALTARLGVAAVDICRPLPFVNAPPLRARHVVAELFPEFKPSELVRSAFRRDGRKEQKSPQDQ
jgi:putative membrane protein